MPDAFATRLAGRLKELRQDRGWSLDQLAGSSGVSRATLSRLENADVSPTTDILGKLCSSYGITLTRLMMSVEQVFQPHLPRDAQEEWTDQANGFTRRMVSPPSASLAAEVIEGRIEPDRQLIYDRPTRMGMEHHLIMLEGRLEVSLDDVRHSLEDGDCLRYLLKDTSRFQTPPDSGARYLLVLL
ncbi:helix-turn-helix domain-containing protein [Aestuariispira insulae]|uniref:Transcriptional regulator with XRE-family HTH domain n=1 Tax=Aestuariispira insulae TaxID=1461337 RepID=A0A3D9HIF3_9PROT|nr:XRE family transcriptional regulator [Aestuariispira insulae]RED49233.1 transcriptional regulator with XRE-family HTH domain [Aestuariispira insulae]